MVFDVYIIPKILLIFPSPIILLPSPILKCKPGKNAVLKSRSSYFKKENWSVGVKIYWSFSMFIKEMNVTDEGE